MVSTATETREQPRRSSATCESISPVPEPHPPLKYSFHPCAATSPTPQRSYGTIFDSAAIAYPRWRGTTYESRCRKNFVSPRAVTCVSPQIDWVENDRIP